MRCSKNIVVIYILIFLLWFCFVEKIYAEKTFSAGYENGFYIKSEKDEGMEFRLGGAFQVDYRHYGEKERADNGFDIRRARLIFHGQLTEWFRFGLEYEFQGNEIKHLIDAYGEAVIGDNHGFRFGQFKEPFSLEWQTKNEGLYFAERSMGYYLTPKRGIGVMLYGSFYQDTLNYAVGLFNGDGVDGSFDGEEDSPEIATRLVFCPFKTISITWLNSLQIGGSATYAKIDLSNIDLEVKSAGMTGTNRNLYILRHNTKFGVLQNVEERLRLGLDACWILGQLSIAGEYTQLKYTDLKPSSESLRDANFSSWYVSGFYCFTGEHFTLINGRVKPLSPKKFFNPSDGTLGAFVLALRAEHFTGDKDWIQEEAFVSVEEADAYTIAINWILHPTHNIVFDYTHTDFTDPIRVRVNPNGHVDYIDEENVFTIRLSINF